MSKFSNQHDVFVPYEDVQIEKNGDVPEYQELLKRVK